jgi:hypothetical protein
LNCNWDDLDGNEVEESTNQYKSTLNKCKKYFKNRKFDKKQDQENANKIIGVCDDVINELSDFAKYVPIAVCLRTQGMYMRHWDQLTKDTGKTFEFDGEKPKFNFKTLVDMGLDACMDVIEDVSTRAMKEFGIAKELEKITTDWAPVEFEFNIMKNTKDILLIRNFEDCVGLTDEHLGMITNLNFSP